MVMMQHHALTPHKFPTLQLSSVRASKGRAYCLVAPPAACSVVGASSIVQLSRARESVMEDLLPYLDTVTCECLNAEDAHPLRNALAEECRDDPSLALKSDVDEGAAPWVGVSTAMLRRLRRTTVRGSQNYWSFCAFVSW